MQTQCDCGGTRDTRAAKCRSCHLANGGPRKGTGKGWYIHETLGYIIGYVNGRQWYRHRYVMSRHLKRELLPEEHVHHIDGDKTNNKLKNLQVISASDHGREHMTPKAHEMSKRGHAARWGAQNSDV